MTKYRHLKEKGLKITVISDDGHGLNQMMNKASQDELEWFVDEESESEYKWNYNNPLNGSVTRMVYSFQTKAVTVDTRYPLRK